MNRLFYLLTLTLLWLSAYSQIPRAISYQGAIVDANGAPITDGDHTIRLKLYDAQSAGTELFAETQNVAVKRGVFSVMIGEASGGLPDSLLFDRPYFLGIMVDGTTELVPRTLLTSVPYALRAAVAEIAEVAETAKDAQNAQVAQSLAPGVAGVVTSLNGGEGGLTLKGSGGTTINRVGDTIIIASTEPSGATGIQGLQNTDGSIAITNPNGPVANISVSPSALQWTLNGTNISNTNSGNVGIGTNTPVTKLEINGTTRTTNLQITSGAASGRMLVSNASGTAVWTTDMKIVSGNIGIGDTTPKGKLHIMAGNSGFDPTFVRSMVLEEDGHLTLSLRGPANMEQSILFERPVGDTGLRISSQPSGDMRIGRYRFTDNGSASTSFQLFLDVQTGNFGIGRDPVANELEVDGTASKTTAGDWLANSDRRIKSDITDIDESFITLLKLRPVRFRYSDEWRSRNPSIEDRYYHNFIAQEYRQVFPHAVKGSGEYLPDDPSEILQIDTYDAQVVTIKAVQELIRANSMLEEKNVMLQKHMESMEREMSVLRQMIEKLSEQNLTAQSVR